MAGSNITFNLVANDKASGKVDKFGRNLGAQSKKFDALKTAGVAALTAAAVAGGVFVAKSITAASDLSETLNKSSVIFGDNAAAMEKWGDKAATSVGLSKEAALGAAATFGDMFSQLGMGSEEAAKTSQEVVQLGADLGSFHNLETADVLDRISAATRGEYDSLQALIPNINAARVEQEALAMTGKDTADALTQQEKVSATLALIHKDGASAAGDFAETSGGLANQQKILGASVTDLQAKLGTRLVPVLATVVKWFTSKVLPAIGKFSDFIDQKIVPAVTVFWDALTGKSEIGEFDGIMGRINDAGAVLFDWAQRAGSYFTGTLVPAFQDLGGWIVRNRDWLTALAVGIGAGVVAWKLFTGAIAAWQMATKAAAAVQLAFNAVMSANPIGLIITAIAALVAGLVWFFTKTELGQKIWAGFTDFLSVAWEKIKGFFQSGWESVSAWLGKVLDFVKKVWSFSPIGLITSNWSKITAYISGVKDKVVGFFQTAWNFIKKAWSYSPIGLITSNWSKITGFLGAIPGKVVGFFSNIGVKIGNKFSSVKSTVKGYIDSVLDWFRGIPGKIGGFFSSVGSKITSPFKTAFNSVARFWNNSVGKVSFSVPNWVPGMGGKSFGIPKIPLLAKGGILTGPTLFVGGEGGETEVVQPLSKLSQFMRDFVPRDEGPAGSGGGDTYFDLSGATFEVRDDDGSLMGTMRAVAGQVVKANRSMATAGRRGR